MSTTTKTQHASDAIPDTSGVDAGSIALQAATHRATGVERDDPNVIEMVDRASSRLERDGSDIPGPAPAFSPTKAQRVNALVQLFSLSWMLFLAGWNDGSLGPLLPRIQEEYNVGFTMISLLFVFTSLGFIGGSLLNVPLTDQLGFGKMIAIGSVLTAVGYALVSAAPPFPAFILGYAVVGAGLSVLEAQAIGYAVSLHDPSTKIAIVQASYGAGALIAPLVSTQFAQRHRWSFHFLISLGIAIMCLALVLYIFRLRGHDDCLERVGQMPRATGTSEHSKFRQILSIPAVHLMAFFIMVYVGVEVTLGGWIVTYIIDVRHGGPSSGYISAGFFGGLMVGRLTILWLNRIIGEKRAMFIDCAFAIAFEILIWFVPSLVGDAVAISVVGLFFGPMYPIAMNHAGRILPQWLLTGAVGWIAGFGQAGSATLPFLTGALASKTGIKSLQPLVVSMMALMMILWALIPKQIRRPD